MAAKRRQGPVETATRAELRRMGVKTTENGLAAAAVALAKQLDMADGPAAAAAAGRELRSALVELRKQVPAQQQRDVVDELSARRAVRKRA